MRAMAVALVVLACLAIWLVGMPDPKSDREVPKGGVSTAIKTAGSAPIAAPAAPWLLSIRRGGCGSKGGPGYRTHSGRCASWRDYRRHRKH